MHSAAAIQDAIRQLRAPKSDDSASCSTDDMSMLIKQSIKDSKIAAIRSVVRELYITELRSKFTEGDFSIFGESSEEVKRLHELSSQYQKTSISARNATACLVTINPPSTLDIHKFRDYIENLIQKIQSSGYSGSYYFEARSHIKPYGAHVHIALDLDSVEAPPEFRKTLVQKCMAKKLCIFEKRPSHDQLNVKFSSHVTGYTNFIKYATNKKKIIDGVDISTPLREELSVSAIIEF